MKLFKEEEFRSFIKPYLFRCRPGDWEHACRVVNWVKKLIDRNKTNLNLFIIAAYIHDIGWLDLISDGSNKISTKQLFNLEPKANSNTENNVNLVLRNICEQNEINFILKLIAAADKHKALDIDEAIIVDADSLSKLCREHVEEKFGKLDWFEIYELWEKEMPLRIKTELGKKLYPDLLAKLRMDLKLV